jgi:hypothetical protein
MNADRTLTETFADHEHLAPDPNASWAAIAARLEPRRPRRVLAMVGAAATVAALAVGGTVALRHDAPPPAPPVAPVTTAPAADRRPRISIDADRLPAGAVPEFAWSDRTQSFGFLIGDVHLSLFVDGRGKLPPKGTRTTVDGYQAVELKAGTTYYALAFLVPGRGLVQVDLLDPAGATKGGPAIARRVAESVVLDRPRTVPVPFVPTYRPRGLDPSEFMWNPRNAADLTYYRYRDPGKPGAEPALSVAEKNGTFAASGRKSWPAATPGRRVLGHPTHVVRGRTSVVWIDSVLPGRSIVVTGVGIPLEELYRVADGIRRT